jgi:hypothetical protein
MKFGMYAIGDKRSLMIFNHLHSVISTSEWIKDVAYNGDNAIAHVTPRIQPNLT